MQEAALWLEEDFQAVADGGAGVLGRPRITKHIRREDILKGARVTSYKPPSPAAELR